MVLGVVCWLSGIVLLVLWGVWYGEFDAEEDDDDDDDA